MVFRIPTGSCISCFAALTSGEPEMYNRMVEERPVPYPLPLIEAFIAKPPEQRSTDHVRLIWLFALIGGGEDKVHQARGHLS